VSLRELKDLEIKIDSEVAQLAIWKLPVRAILTAVHYSLYTFFRTDREKAITVAGRMSHLVQFLAKCPAEPTGASALDAFSAYMEMDPKIEQLMLAINYSHFSEVMPQVHRGYYSVTKVNEKHLRLDHASTELANAETRDIVLSELAMPHIAAPPPNVQAEIQQLAHVAPKVDLKLMSRVLGSYIDHYLKHIVEPPLLSDETLIDAFGLNNAELARFTALLLAIASYAIDLSKAIEPRARAEAKGLSAVEAEWLEWVSVCWKEDFLRHLLNAVTTDASKIDALLSIFSLNFRVDPPQTDRGGEGYFPPMALLRGESVVIGPYLTFLYAHTRNVLYALQRLDQTKFDEVVSHGLEPQILLHAQSMLRRLPGVDVVPNVVWDTGEIDLLVFEEASNTALQIQAKAAIAPYGTRMISRLEGRVREGIRQLQDFRALPQEKIDAIISKAVGKTVSGVRLVDAVLARSCFGSKSSWSNSAGVCFVSLAILEELTKSGKIANINELPRLVAIYLDSVILQAGPIWTHKPLRLGEWTLEVPMLDFNQRYLDRERIRVWA
jgi:hypothetical protein